MKRLIEQMINKVMRGASPLKIIKEQYNPGDMSGDNPLDARTPGPRQLWGVDNNIVLLDVSQGAQAESLLKSKFIRYERFDNVFAFEINSQRDGAAQLLKSNGIKIKALA